MNSKLKYEINYLNPNIDKNIIQKYWEIDESKFNWKYNIDEVARMKGLRMNQISKYIKENSEFILFCSDCKNVIGNYNLKSKIQMIEYYNKNGFICDNCYKEPEVKIMEKTIMKEIEPKYTKADKLNIAFQTKQWLDLNQIELEIICIIAESESKEEIYNKVFTDGDLKSDYSRFYWKIIDKLDDKNLIWVDRNENGKINYFHKHGNLYNQLLKKYPDLILKRPNISPPKKYCFTLEKNKKTKSNQPDFIGKIKLSRKIELNTNFIYDCAGWINKKEDLYIRINEE